jgi:hypothetical protein
MIDLAKGIRRTGPVTTLGAAAVANAAAVYQISNFAGQVGTKSVRLKKVMARTAGLAADILHIGTGAGGTFADLIPAINLLAGSDAEWQEVELPGVEAYADITAYGEAVGAHIVQLEVEEIG